MASVNIYETEGRATVFLPMITPSEIKTKAERLYPQFIKAWLADDDDFLPRRIPANLRLPPNHAEAFRAVEALRNQSKEIRGFGYSLQWELQKRLVHGLNQFPVAIQIETENDLLRLADKRVEFQSLQTTVQSLRSLFPQLETWLGEKSNWKMLVESAAVFGDLLLVTKYLLDNPRPNCFPREIPLPISTKLIEENRKLLAQWLDRLLPPDQIDVRHNPAEFEARYGLSYVRSHLMIRLLDESLRAELGLPFGELSLTADSIGSLPVASLRVYIVENKVNLLTLPAMKRSIGLGGLGKAVSLLRNIGWLSSVPIFYWGDFDVEGFEMLSQIRAIFPETKSLLMNRETFEQFENLAIPWTNQSRFEPQHLTESELKLYHHLRNKKLRLEQERIPQAYIASELCRLSEPS